MNTKDILTIATVALGTATLTVMTFWSSSLEAGDDSNVLAARIAKPQLTSHGIALSLTVAANRTFKEGDEPEFKLQAINTTGEPATTTVRIAMTASSPGDALSRVIRLPSRLWDKELTLALKPNESKAIIVSAQTKLPAKSLISVSLQDSESLSRAATTSSGLQTVLRPAATAQPGVVVMSFSTVDPAAQVVSIR